MYYCYDYYRLLQSSALGDSCVVGCVAEAASPRPGLRCDNPRCHNPVSALRVANPRFECVLRNLPRCVANLRFEPAFRTCVLSAALCVVRCGPANMYDFSGLGARMVWKLFTQSCERAPLVAEPSRACARRGIKAAQAMHALPEPNLERSRIGHNPSPPLHTVYQQSLKLQTPMLTLGLAVHWSAVPHPLGGANNYSDIC